MPSFQAIVEDTAPFLVYSANWRAGTSADDSSADKYTQSSFTVTQAANATMSFTFFGTYVGIYGAKRGNHGPYQVQVDNQQYPIGNGVATPDAFNQTLFSTNLQNGLHTVTLTNNANTYLDVDYVSWQTSVGNDAETLIVNTYQDSHPAFSYSPTSSWGTPDFVSSFSGSTGHATTTPGAFAEFTFAGDAVGLYGPVGPSGAAAFSVQVDGGTPMNSTTNKQFYRPQQLLYYGSNLGSGIHTLKIQFGSSSGSNQALAIDYAEVYTTPSLGGSFGTTLPVRVASAFPIGATVGLAITSTLAFLALAAVVFLFLQRHKNHLFSSLRTDPETPTMSGLRVEPFSFQPTPQNVSIVNQNHHHPNHNHNPSDLSFTSSSDPTTTTGYPSTFSATRLYDNYVTSTAEARRPVTKDRLGMGTPSAPLGSRVMASDTSYTIPQPSGSTPILPATTDPLVGDTVPPPEYHT